MSWYKSNIAISSSQEYVPPSWSTGSDADIVTALEKHYAREIDLREYWAVGDERTVHLSAMSAYGEFTDTYEAQDATFVIMNVGGKKLADNLTECAFIVGQKNCVGDNTIAKIYPNTNKNDWANSPRRSWCNDTFYNAIPSTLRPIFKQFTHIVPNNGSAVTPVIITDYVSLPAVKEVTGDVSLGVNTIEQTLQQFEWYKTASNRQKYNRNDSPAGQRLNEWWTRSACISATSQMIKIQTDGTSINYNAMNQCNLSPFMVI